MATVLSNTRRYNFIICICRNLHKKYRLKSKRNWNLYVNFTELNKWLESVWDQCTAEQKTFVEDLFWYSDLHISPQVEHSRSATNRDPHKGEINWLHYIFIHLLEKRMNGQPYGSFTLDWIQCVLLIHIDALSSLTLGTVSLMMLLQFNFNRESSCLLLANW